MERSRIKKNFINYVDRIVTNGKISHAYLIEVGNYDEDLKYVYNFIKMILSNEKYEVVEKDKSNKLFNLIDEGNFPDISVVSSSTSIIKKDSMIDLKNEFSNTSLYGTKRFYIVEEAEKFNAASANTILKFLEEPDDDIVAILLTDNRYHVIDTIISRCQILSLRDNDFEDSDYDDVVDLIEYFLSPKKFFINRKDVISTLLPDKATCITKLKKIENLFINYIDSRVLNINDNKDIYSIFNNISINSLVSILSIIEDFFPDLSYNVNYNLWIDSLFGSLIKVEVSYV